MSGTTRFFVDPKICKKTLIHLWHIGIICPSGDLNSSASVLFRGVFPMTWTFSKTKKKRKALSLNPIKNCSGQLSFSLKCDVASKWSYFDNKVWFWTPATERKGEKETKTLLENPSSKKLWRFKWGVFLNMKKILLSSSAEWWVTFNMLRYPKIDIFISLVRQLLALVWKGATVPRRINNNKKIDPFGA